MPYISVDKNNKPIVDCINNNYVFNAIPQENTIWFDETSKEYFECLFYNNKQAVLQTLNLAHSHKQTWLLILQSGDFTKNNWDLNVFRDEISAFISSEIIEPMPLTFYNTKNEAKVVSIDPKKMPAMSLKRIIIVQQIGAKRLELFNAIQSATKKNIDIFTEEYLQGEFDKINKTIIID